MPQRFLRPGITTSELWNACTFPAQSLYVRLLTLVDDYGRFDGRASVIQGYCFALRSDMKIEKVRLLIEELCQNGLIQAYSVEEKEFIRILKWAERARGASKYPAPPDEDHEGEPSGTIYFVQAGDTERIKIGFTQWTAEQRLRRLQVGSSEKLKLLTAIPGTVKEERALHRKFAADNVGGEWFILSKDITAFIASSANGRKCVQPAGVPHEKTLPSPLVISHRSSPSPTAIASGAPGLKKPSRGNTEVDDTEWKKGLMEDVAYKHINIPAEFSKWQRWCVRKKKKPTQGRFEAWLNNIEAPVTAFAGSRTVKPPKILPDPPPEISEEKRLQNLEEMRRITETLAGKFSVGGS